MSVKMHNDGKGKRFSFEASIDIGTIQPCCGETEEEAIEELREDVLRHIKKLQALDYSRIDYVDCFGKPL